MQTKGKKQASMEFSKEQSRMRLEKQTWANLEAPGAILRILKFHPSSKWQPPSVFVFSPAGDWHVRIHSLSSFCKLWDGL